MKSNYQITAAAAVVDHLEHIPAIIVDMDDEDAIIRLVDSNIQRENILPSERAYAYKMRMDAIKRKAGNGEILMKDVRKLGSQCMADLASINIPYGKVRLWVVNCRAKARWGLCKKRPDGCYEIEIAEALLQDDVSDIAVKNTIIHELLHTCPGCFKHTGRWKQYADRVNRYLPQYNIKRTTSAEEKGVAVRRKEPVYRYILKCCDCGNEIRRQKKSAAIEHPEHYRCKCGGKLIRVQ